MDQYTTIRAVREKLRELIDAESRPLLAARLGEIDRQLEVFHETGIDFKEVVDNLDDSVFITDSQGNVLYINPAYTRNTGITEADVLGRNIRALIGPDKVYTGGVAASVLEKQKTVFRLSTTYKSGVPQVGYVMGIPVFKEDGSLRHVIACSRPIVSLVALQDDFEAFRREINALHPRTINRESNKSLSGNMLEPYRSLEPIRVLIARMAPTDATILITGESGVGKEVVADEIYRRSLRRDKPYVKINCASIPAHLLESELFGYEKGAFTGAGARKIGLFEYANGGTLMLDEIGEMPMDLQAKLLRAIQSQEITRIGGTKPIKLNIRFLALTNADLKKKIAAGTFRQDLYYRLNVIPLHVPPLRDRLQDLELLCQHFITHFSEKYHCTFTLTERQLAYMRQYDWPGNIRELENMMEYMILLGADIGQISDDVLCGLLNLTVEQPAYAPPALPACESPELPAVDPEQGIDFNRAVADFEKRLLEQVLATSSNLREASRKLHINASTISRKIRQYNIDYANRRA